MNGFVSTIAEKEIVTKTWDSAEVEAHISVFGDFIEVSENPVQADHRAAERTESEISNCFTRGVS